MLHLNIKSSKISVCLFFKKIVICLLYMNNQKLIIYDFDIIYKIFNELSDNLNFKILCISKSEFIKKNFYELNNCLIITKKNIPTLKNQIILDHFPIKILKLIERINIEFLKLKFSDQSEIDVGNYKINLNSREMFSEKGKIKLTEKESKLIVYLSKSKNPIRIQKLQSDVWDYQPQLETHTVETHIYRLRKKIIKKFSDDNFIVSNKNGYQIK
ncbi:MAG: response regulator transcription factor [Pelagibacteraceae bacterium]|nr:response regulator transcription factor [Pelagibacteraceae bacterium]PHX89215.1 MAG: transcriptional regulator [Pelagibacteraceae bacterium]